MFVKYKITEIGGFKIPQESISLLSHGIVLHYRHLVYCTGYELPTTGQAKPVILEVSGFDHPFGFTPFRCTAAVADDHKRPE